MNKFLKWVIYISMAIIPFLAFYVTSVNPMSMQMLFPYITGKNFAFRILVEVAAAAWLMLMIINKDYRPKKSLILYAYSAFIFILLIANIFSVNPERSFFSNFERMEGFIAHAHLFLYFLILISIFKTREMWENAKIVLFISNIPVLLLGLLQLLGLPNIVSDSMPTLRDTVHKYFSPSQGAAQLDSSLGNSTYFAIYCVFFIFLFAMSFIESKIKNDTNPNPIYLVMMVLNLIVLFYTGTRGAQLGFVIGVFISLAIIFFAGKKWTELKSVRDFSFYGLIAILFFVITFASLKDTQFVKASPSLSKIAKVFAWINPATMPGRLIDIKNELYNKDSTYESLLAVVGDSTMTSRFLNMKMGLDGFKERPLLGWGQDNYFYVFAKYNDPRMYAQEPWFDRSHNVFFDWLIASGALGLLAYLSLYFMAIYTMWFAKASRRHHDSYIDFIEKALITGLLLAYFIHNIFVFDNIISYILFFSLLAYIAVRFDHSEKSKEENQNKKSNIIKNVDDRVVIYGPIIILVLGLSLYYLNFRYIKANLNIISGISPQQQPGDTGPIQALERSLNGFKSAADISGIAMMESREQLAQQSISLISQLRNANLPQNDETAPIYNLVLNFVEATKSEYESLLNSQKTKDPRSLSIYGTFLQNIGENEKALEYMKAAHDAAPMKQTITTGYIQSLIISKKYSQAELIAEKMFNSDKSYKQGRIIYAMALAYNSKFDEALIINPDLKNEIEKIKKELGK